MKGDECRYNYDLDGNLISSGGKCSFYDPSSGRNANLAYDSLGRVTGDGMRSFEYTTAGLLFSSPSLAAL